MPQNKKHHYVPRFLLKRFSVDKKSINLFNIKSQKKIIGGNLYNQCYTNYLYGKDGDLEKGLAQVETELANLLRAMDQAIAPPLPRHDVYDLMLLFILSQRGRTQYAVDSMNEMFDKMVKSIFAEKIAVDLKIDPNSFKVGMRDPGRESLKTTLMTYPLLLDMQAKTLLNKTNEGFVLSDNPVVFYNQLMSFENFGSNCGIASKGLQIFVPVDSRKMLHLYDPAVYRVGPKDHVVDITNPSDVYELNTLQVVAASDNIYFEDAAQNVEALYKKAAPFLRTQRVSVQEFPFESPDGGKSKYLAGSSQDVRTNLNLSFVSVLGAVKKWRDKYRKQEWKSAQLRNDKLVGETKLFGKELENGTYHLFEFRKYMEDKIAAAKAAPAPAPAAPPHP